MIRDIHQILRQYWGHASFRSAQEEVIRSVLEGQDTLALLPTGAGKSICFQVPALATGRLCLVVSPLIALMKDQVQGLKERDISAVAITSGMRQVEIENALESCALGKRSFLYVSPERLASELFKGRLPRLPLGLIAVDEAHCISQWGYDFRPAYSQIRDLRVAVPDVPILALTASATPRVAEDIMDKLAFREPNVIRTSFRRPEITWWVSEGEDKSGRLIRSAKKVSGSGIVYVRERRGTVRTARLLNQHGISAAAYHAGMDMRERDTVQRSWMEGATRFVVATTAFGMGIDKSDVRAVVHLDPPPDLESYYQEAGRCGRDGGDAHAVILCDQGDRANLRERVMNSFPPITEVRRVYQAFADTHRIALGSGLLETYSLDLRELASSVDLKPATVLQAIKALELDGTLSMGDGGRDPSRLLITAPHATVYNMRVADERLGPLIEAALRLYGGIYEGSVPIEEPRIASLLKWPEARVITGLKELEQLGVLMYKARREGPTITLLVPVATLPG